MAERLGPWSVAAALALAAATLAGVLTVPTAVLLVVCAVAFGCGAFAATLPGAAATVVLLIALLVAYGIPEDSAVPLVLCVAGPWLAGRAVRSRRLLVDALAARTRELESEQEAYVELAVRHERARVARELHDIVAHHLAVIVVQAGAGRMAAPEAPARAAQRLAVISSAAAEAVGEMDRLLDVLDTDPDDRDRALATLAERARAAGLHVELSPLPDGVRLEPEVEATAHRIVQEGLTNALKHAPGAGVRVRLALADGTLEVEVRDDGARTPATLAGAGAGAGLPGLRERVAAAGGTLVAEPYGRDGWRLLARLPAGDRRLIPVG